MRKSVIFALMGAFLVVSGCLTTNKGLGEITALPDIMELRAGSPLEKCLIDQELIQETDLDFDKLEEIEVEAATQTNLLRGLSAGLQGQPGIENAGLFLQAGYTGYSAKVRGISWLLEQGKFDAAAAYLARRSANYVSGDSDGFKTARQVGSLGLIMRGSIALDRGDVSCATVFLRAAEDLIEDKESGSYAQALLRATTDYSVEGYERVLLLNQYALGTILEGNPAAYPVTQRARRYQDEQRIIYEDELDKARDEEEAYDGTGTDTSVEDILADQGFRENAKIAARVSSPFVNPLADYLSAALSEIEATAPNPRSDVWGDAVIAWKKTSELAGDNPSVRQGLADALVNSGMDPQSAELTEITGDLPAIREAAAVPEYRAQTHDDQRIIHVIAALGLAPERKVAIARIPFDTSFLALKLPYQDPVDTSASRLLVEIGDQKQELNLISDIEAMIMRQYQDRLPLDIAGAAISAIGGYVAGQQVGQWLGDESPGGGLFGALTNELTQQATMPSTTGWTGLPQSYLVARLVVPKGIDQLRLTLLDSWGDPMRVENVPILPDDSLVVYARAVDGYLSARAQLRPYDLDFDQTEAPGKIENASPDDEGHDNESSGQEEEEDCGFICALF